MSQVKYFLFTVFLCLAIGISVDAIPFEYKIIMFAAMFVIGAMLLGGVLVAFVMDGWDAMERGRRHGP